MTTLEQREYAGVNSVTKQDLPRESKYDSDSRKDEARLHRIEAKELSEFNKPMVEFNKSITEFNPSKKLTEMLGNPRDIIGRNLGRWEFESISDDEARHTPYN